MSNFTHWPKLESIPPEINNLVSTIQIQVDIWYVPKQ